MNNIKSIRKLPQYIDGDDLSLKISSYPVFLTHLSERLGCKYSVLLELCTGIGIGLIYLQKNFKTLYGIEIDPSIVEISKLNLIKAELSSKVSVIQADVVNILNFTNLKPDVVIYDIPYWSDHNAGLLKRNPDIKALFEKINTHLTKNIIIYSPPRFDYTYYKDLFVSDLEVEEIFINNKHDRNVLFFGNLVNKVGSTKVFLNT
jgi:tRNA1(Val) A37 N6-methylase TrmN6